MSMNHADAPVAEMSGTPGVPINITPSGLAALQLYRQEIATYLRELPRLLAEGHSGRYLLVKNDNVLGVWDEQVKAIQAGVDQFGLDPLYVKKIEARDPERYALLKSHLASSCPL